MTLGELARVPASSSAPAAQSIARRSSRHDFPRARPAAKRQATDLSVAQAVVAEGEDLARQGDLGDLGGAPLGDPLEALPQRTLAEDRLLGGVDDDSLPILELPEGTSYVHVVAVSRSRMKSATPGQVALRVDKTYPVTQLTGAPTGWTNRALALTRPRRTRCPG